MKYSDFLKLADAADTRAIKQMIDETWSAWSELSADDITFCDSRCENVGCRRHPSHILHKDIPHSMAAFRGTRECPFSGGKAEGTDYSTPGGKIYAKENRAGKE